MIFTFRKVDYKNLKRLFDIIFGLLLLFLLFPFVIISAFLLAIDLKENPFSKEGLENLNKIQLQEFYGSFFGKNKEEVKKNSQKIRFKIYFYGLIIISVILVVTFLFNRVSFVTA